VKLDGTEIVDRWRLGFRVTAKLSRGAASMHAQGEGEPGARGWGFHSTHTGDAEASGI